MKKASLKPEIFDFLDVIQFLQAHFDWRKSMEGISYSVWATELGFGNNTLLRFILQRKRTLSDRNAIVFKSNLRLSDEEGHYFDILLHYTQAATVEEKRSLGESLIKMQRRRYVQVEVDAQDGVKAAWAPIILTLLSFEDFLGELENIAMVLGASHEVVFSALQGLIDAGLIYKEGNQYFSQLSAFKVPNADQNKNLRNFHSYWLDRAKDAMDLPAHTRKYRSLQFALSEEEFNSVIEKINDFALTLLTSAHSQTITEKRLYMFESIIFPLSVKISGLTEQIIATDRIITTEKIAE